MAQEPSVYVQVSWDMEWDRLCNFIDFFAKKLAKELFETKVLYPYDVKPSRIRFMNAQRNCQDKGSEEDAILKFFVSESAEKDLGVGDVDRNITILAYKRLYDYWKNKKMALLDPIFIGKVGFSGLILPVAEVCACVGGGGGREGALECSKCFCSCQKRNDLGALFLRASLLVLRIGKPGRGPETRLPPSSATKYFTSKLITSLNQTHI